MQSTVLILGARGRFGLATARAFADAGWRVWGQMRPGAAAPAEMSGDARVQWLGIDLGDTPGLQKAAHGATVVVHALNPAYTHKAWRAQVLPMLDDTLRLARALNATVMLPGNVYNFGAGMPAVLREDTPQSALTVKGQIRIALEQKLQTSGVRSVVIRAGDFFGSGQGTWFDSIIVKDIQKGVFTYPGYLNRPTAWAYLPDLARSFVAVAGVVVARPEALQAFENFHFKGASLSGQQWLDALTLVARAHGWIKPQGLIRFKRLPWLVIRLASPFVATWGALMEMRYLWDTPHALDNAKLQRLIGPEPHTPLVQAAGQALADLGLIESGFKPAVQPVPQCVANAQMDSERGQVV